MQPRPPSTPSSRAAPPIREETRVVGGLLSQSDISLPATSLPATSLLAEDSDPWASVESSAARWQRNARLGAQVGKQVARRGVGLAAVLAVAGLGALLLLPLLLVLGVGVANGSAPAGWLLGVTLLLGLLGLLWTGRQAARLLRSPLSVPPTVFPTAASAREISARETSARETGAEETGLLRLLRQHERKLSPVARPALHATVIATRDALRATAEETMLSRAAFDARQAAREDLPELLAAYQALPNHAANEATLLEQLRLIEQRMAEVRREQIAAQRRTLAAHGQYLSDKYRKDSE